MNNSIKRVAIFAVLGAILSSAVLVGCGSKGDDTDTNAPAANKPAADNGTE